MSNEKLNAQQAKGAVGGDVVGVGVGATCYVYVCMTLILCTTLPLDFNLKQIRQQFT